MGNEWKLGFDKPIADDTSENWDWACQAVTA